MKKLQDVKKETSRKQPNFIDLPLVQCQKCLDLSETQRGVLVFSEWIFERSKFSPDQRHHKCGGEIKVIFA